MYVWNLSLFSSALSLNSYSLPGRIAFTMMPTRDAIARPESEIVAPKAVKEMPPMELNPSAHTRMRAAMIVFLLLVKSTLFSTTFLIPMAEIMP